MMPRTDLRAEGSGDHAPKPHPAIEADGVLGQLLVWSEAEWAELHASERPFRYEHVPGLGWIGLISLPTLNN
jgi:hypothetical protein